MEACVEKAKCWMLSRERKPTAFCVLGRLGDLMILMPGWKALYDQTHLKPVVIVAREFASIFDGVSYVQPHVLNVNPYTGVLQAIQTGIRLYGNVLVPKWWDDPRHRPPPIIPEPWFETKTIKYQGKTWTMAAKDWDSYQTSQWEHAGFTREQMMEWPLVFDRRSEAREEQLRRQTFKTNKPKLLWNIGGTTNPAPGEHHAKLRAIMTRLHGKFENVDLGHIRAPRIYDLLGLYDKAAGMLTSDTSTLHLAAASKLPFVALLANGGSGSVPRGNCILKVRYNVLGQNLQQIESALNSLS